MKQAIGIITYLLNRILYLQNDERNLVSVLQIQQDVAFGVFHV